MQPSPLILGTRGSALALWQANHVRDRLVASGYPVELEPITTTGDRRLDVPLASIGEKGLFTRELDEALLDGSIHLAVHSLKDLPSVLTEGLALAAITEREHPFDAFVAGPGVTGELADAPHGAVLATSSLRRQAQLKAWRSDLQVVPIRGNVDTRLRKLDASDWYGAILAEAGLVRLGQQNRIRERVALDVMLPAVGQGSLGVVCASQNEELRALLRSIFHHEPSGHASTAERAFLARLEGGCSVPVGAYAQAVGETLTLEGCVGSVDGARLYRERISGSTAESADLGRTLAKRLLDAGAAEVLAELRGPR
ncbi:MAG TPA: hydroxymethylbilane synthase [Rhodothermales bacterium]